jgi:uncharacterized protein YjbJ (UPF0337 family)
MTKPNTTSTENKIKGNFLEAKGTVKEHLGRLTNDRRLTREGSAEKKAGNLQRRLGDAKEKVAELKEQLKDVRGTKSR